MLAQTTQGTQTAMRHLVRQEGGTHTSYWPYLNGTVVEIIESTFVRHQRHLSLIFTTNSVQSLLLLLHIIIRAKKSVHQLGCVWDILSQL
eukprot:COSAG01_NODE_81_length_27820_cov_22.659753_7_plen_90_part_00